MSKKINKYFFIAVLIGTLFFITAIFTSKSENVLINSEKVTLYNEGWRYTVNGSDGGKLGPLPQKIDFANKNDRVVIKNKLPESYVQGMTVCFRSVQQFVRVFVNGEQVYEYGYGGTRLFGKSPGSAWNFVRLDNKTAGGEIEIELVSPYKDYANTVNEIHYGSKNANVFYIISGNIVGFSVSLLLILIGIMLLLMFGFLRRHGRSDALLYLGLFAIFAGLWSTVETRMLQFAFSNQGNLTIFAFLAMMLMGVPLLLFIAETHSIHNKKPFYTMCILLLINYPVAILLQAFNIVDFIEFPLPTHILLIASIALVVVSILVEIIKYKNKEIYILGIGSCTLALISLLDFPQFYNKMSGDNSFFFRFGVLIYILILSFYTLKQLLNMTMQNMQTKALQQLAYVDLLTNLNNRTAFEIAMEHYRNGDSECFGMAMAVFDVNDLKFTNDTYGHKAGDDLIIQSSDCLRRAFSGKAGIFRVGGDEFAVIVSDARGQLFDSMIAAFEKEVVTENLRSARPLSLAYGFAEFDAVLDKDVDALYVRADGYMYEKKAQMKGISGRRRSDRAKETDS